MLQYLINVTDNTFVSAIMLAFLIVIVVRVNPLHSKKIIISGFLVGFLPACVFAILKRNTGFAVREFYDLAVIISWVSLVIPFLIIMWLNLAIQSRNSVLKLLFSLLFIIIFALITAQFVPNILLYPTQFAVGMDSIFNNDYLFKWVGYCLALMVMLLVAIAIYRLCSRLPDKFVFIIISIALLIFSMQKSINILQIFITRRFIASPQQWMMDLVIFVLGHVNLFTFIFMAIALFLAVTLYVKSKTTALTGSNPAQIRKTKADLRSERRSALMMLAGTAIAAYTITRARYIYEKGVDLVPAEAVELNVNGLIIIALDQVNDGNLHRFSYVTSDDTVVRFIIIKKSENSFGVGLDACDICGASGYYQRGDQIVCILCDVVMNIATIGFSGGCNPVPLKFEIIDGSMVIKPAYLEAEKSRFK